jgi:Fur family ferric uptake transcriptional regulator
MSTEINAIFRANKLRVTVPRLAILKALQEATSPLSIAAIAKECPSVDRTSVYRTVEMFLRINIIAAVPHGWKQRYELAEPLRPHHHHLHCARCDAVTDIYPDGLETFIAHVAKKHGFQATSHMFEITGICQNCLNAKNRDNIPHNQ